MRAGNGRVMIALLAMVGMLVAGCAGHTGSSTSSGSGDASATSASAPSGSATSGSATSGFATSGSASAAGSGGPDSDRCAAAEGDQLTGKMTVFAAASLKQAFDELRTEFTDAHPCVRVPAITYAGSSTLAKQIQDGAPADVFASANETNMDKVADLVTDRADFATNTLQIAVAPGNPKHITSLADLAKPGVVTVICAPPVPCGAASQEALKAADVTLKPASEEQNVKAVLTKVASGDADAGLVYRTDVNSAGGTVEGVDFPQADEAVNTYPIAVLKNASDPDVARVFVRWVRGAKGHHVLTDIGFGAP